VFHLIFAASTVACSLDTNTPARIIERAIAARGAWNGKGEVAVRTTTRWSEPSTGKRSTGTHTVMPPDRFRGEESWTEGGREVRHVTVYDGKRGWESFDGITRECTPEELATLRALAAYDPADDLRGMTDAKRCKLSPLPDAQVEGEACVGVRVEEAGRPTADLYFSKRTHLLRKTAGRRPGPDGEMHDCWEVRSDYKDFEGRKFATRTVRQAGPFLTLQSTLEKVEYIPAADTAKLFTKP
jgi:hypothetical protein